MRDPDKALKALYKPPSVVNWVRHNLQKLEPTRRRLLAFAIRPPRHSLSPAYKIIARMAYGELREADAILQAEGITQPITRMAALELIPAFSRYIEDNDVRGIKELDGFYLPFPIGRSPDSSTLTIPIRPTFVGVTSDDKLVPYFIVGWSSFALIGFQKRLLSTIICNSLLTHQYFLGSESQIVALPRIPATKVRRVQEWPATLYGDLSEADLLEQFERYGKALTLVARELRGE